MMVSGGGEVVDANEKRGPLKGLDLDPDLA